MPPDHPSISCLQHSAYSSQQITYSSKTFWEGWWILLWTHVWRWHFRYNMDSGRHEMCPLWFLSVLNASWMTSLWSEYTWSYKGGIRREIVSSAGLDQVHKFRLQQLKLFEICNFSQPVGIFKRTFSLTLQVSALDSHWYFPHQTWNKPFEMILN